MGLKNLAGDDSVGHYFVLGGNVRGGQILGDYPSRLHTEHNPLDAGAYRVIPTIPWEVTVFVFMFCDGFACQISIEAQGRYNVL